jgi:hypothetical protein
MPFAVEHCGYFFQAEVFVLFSEFMQYWNTYSHKAITLTIFAQPRFKETLRVLSDCGISQIPETLLNFLNPY